MLGRLNICSKEYLIRQYDHEVKGGSVVKPLTGVKRDGPSDAGVIRPILESEAGLVISHGICPKYGDYDAYWMMANAMDEGIRNAVAVGADPDRMAGVDNFCWCDPVQSEKTPDGEYKLAQLVRACKALSELCVAYGVPCISGKDSMKNDYTGGGKKISIPPTVLFSVLGIMDDVKKAVTSDFKKPATASTSSATRPANWRAAKSPISSALPATPCPAWMPSPPSPATGSSTRPSTAASSRPAMTSPTEALPCRWLKCASADALARIWR